MADNQTKQQTATVVYNAPRPVNIGDVFYMIAQGETKQFYEPCKACNDTHSVTVNGVTFGCPCCNKGAQAIFVQQHSVGATAGTPNCRHAIFKKDSTPLAVTAR